jgi:hypothetical protein
MPERIFTTLDEEYTAASWLSTLKVMQQLGGRIDGQKCTAAKLCSIVLRKPDEFLDEFSRYASQMGDEETTEKAFIREIGAVSRDGRIVQGLSDAALLLCDDPISQEVRELSSFARLVPLIDEMANYCDGKFLKDIRHDDLKDVTYPTRLSYVRAEADFYIRQYDGEPETVAISPLYL